MTNKKNLSKTDEEKLENLEKEISDKCSDKEFEKLTKVLGELETESGGTNSTNVWKEMRKAYPKKSKPLPNGVKNVEENPEEKKKITLKHFEHQMRQRRNKEEVKEIIESNEKTFEMRIEMAKRIKLHPLQLRKY